MAKIHLESPITKIEGALSKNQRVIYRTRNGRTHAYIVENPNTLPPSETQKRNSSVFGLISKQAYAELADPDKRANWEKEFASYTKKHNHPSRRSNYSNDIQPYSSRRKPVITTLYGYVFHILHTQLKEQTNPSTHS